MEQDSEPEAPDVAEELLDVARQLLRRLRTGHLPETDANWRDVEQLRATPGQLGLLRVLVHRQRCTMQELADHLAVAPSTATAMVKRLVAHGYVERDRDEADWRSVWVHPTASGRRILSVYDAARRAALYSRLEQLSADERARILSALPALRHLVEVEP